MAAKDTVVTQFTISAGLLIALILIAQQVNFMRTKNLGFDKDNIINVEIPARAKPHLFGATLSQLPQVKDVTFESAPPSSESHWGTVMSLTNGDDPARQQVTLVLADDHFCKMYGLKLLTGRFPEARDTVLMDRSIPHEQKIMKVVVNETLVRALGFQSNDAALDKHFWVGLSSGNAEIVGVVADFNTSSLHQQIKPVLITQFPVYRFAGIQVTAGSDPAETIAAIESAWKKVFPDGVFEFSFLDQKIDDFYKEEARLYTLFKIFAGIALLISCLGLWGLAAFAAQQRTKEIGIRKVLGASVNTIVMLLSRDFFVMVMIALMIASPLSYYFMKDWLQSFAYRIPISWQVFVFAGMTSVVIALLTISIQTLRAAWANPVESLRNE